MDQRLSEQVHKMAVFISVWHGPNFLKCGLAVTAPSNDLELFYDMLQLTEFDDPDFSRIGAHVAESIQRHTCYLKAPQVIFGLFDEKSSPIDRRLLASALHAIPRPDDSPAFFKPGKLDAVSLLCSVRECVGSPLCEGEEGDLFPRKTLASFVSVKSYLLFNLLGIDDLSWLNAPVALWPCFPSFVKANSFVRDLLVVNDGAERGKSCDILYSISFLLSSGIKLMQELIDRTQDEQDLQFLAQCVSHHRKSIGHKKEDYEKLASI